MTQSRPAYCRLPHRSEQHVDLERGEQALRLLVHRVGAAPARAQQRAQQRGDVVLQQEVLGTRVVLVQAAYDLQQLDAQDGRGRLNHGHEPPHQPAHRQRHRQLGGAADHLAQRVKQLRRRRGVARLRGARGQAHQRANRVALRELGLHAAVVLRQPHVQRLQHALLHLAVRLRQQLQEQVQAAHRPQLGARGRGARHHANQHGHHVAADRRPARGRRRRRRRSRRGCTRTRQGRPSRGLCRRGGSGR
mmetsp:Transcript_24751/g.62836  ORF Transcript_24751/g.62836 Transcript_24751/m.62836 type:complete len:248 (+) Transcript_24751:477-1220(+)